VVGEDGRDLLVANPTARGCMFSSIFVTTSITMGGKPGGIDLAAGSFHLVLDCASLAALACVSSEAVAGACGVVRRPPRWPSNASLEVCIPP
jgi:hypothetical protein